MEHANELCKHDENSIYIGDSTEYVITKMNLTDIYNATIFKYDDTPVDSNFVYT